MPKKILTENNLQGKTKFAKQKKSARHKSNATTYAQGVSTMTQGMPHGINSAAQVMSKT